MKRFLRWASVILSAACLLTVLVSFAVSGIERSKKDETYKELELFADCLALIQSQYAEETVPKDLIYGAMSGVVSNLDPHSQFMTPQEHEDLKVETEGKFGGIGIEITIKDDLVTVITPIEGTPAWDAGLETGDRIVKIDDTVIRNFTLNDAVKRLRGKPGTEVSVVVWREKESKLHSFKIKRAVIDIRDIKEAKVLEDKIGYLKLVEFREDTPQEMDRALADLKNKGMDCLILDLRNNPGGLLDKAVEVAERFLPRNSLVVTIKGRDPKQSSDYKSASRNPMTEMPMVLLVNEGSASGSEIIAGAFQDHKRAVVVGTKTFGKGSVQTVFPLKDGSALKLTTSHYFTPSGRTIHNEGIGPDIVVAQKAMSEAAQQQEKEKEKSLEKIFENVEEKKSESEEQDALEKRYLSDPQLARAVDLLKSIKIYKNIFSVPAKKP